MSIDNVFSQREHTDSIQKNKQSLLGKLLESEDLTGINFFNSVKHEVDGPDKMDSNAQSVFFFTDRPTSKTNGHTEFLPATKDAGQLNSITLGKESISGARVLPTAFASPEELAAHKHVQTTEQVQQIYSTKEKFLDDIAKASQESSNHKVAIFIPGFGMTHDQGIATAANLQSQSGLPVVYYSWPSQDKPDVLSYAIDEKKDEESLERHGMEMIESIADKIGPENLVIAGFSQGGKLAIKEAIERQKNNPESKPFYAQIFSRADAPANEFQANIGKIINNAEHTVVLSSPHDRLLLGSATLPSHLSAHNKFKPSWRVGTTTHFEVPEKLNSRFQVIDDSSANNSSINKTFATNHVLNTQAMANWLKSLN